MFQLEAPGLDLRKVEDVVEDAQQGLRRQLHAGDILPLLAAQRRLFEQADQHHDGVHRGADLMAHIGQELALRPARLLGRQLGVAERQFGQGPLGDVTYGADQELIAVVVGERHLAGDDEVALAPAVGERFLVAVFATGGEHQFVLLPEDPGLLTRKEVEIGLADQPFALGPDEGTIGVVQHDPAVLTVLDEDRIGCHVDDLVEKLLGVTAFSLGPLGRGDIVIDSHHADGLADLVEEDLTGPPDMADFPVRPDDTELAFIGAAAVQGLRHRAPHPLLVLGMQQRVPPLETWGGLVARHAVKVVHHVVPDPDLTHQVPIEDAHMGGPRRQRQALLAGAQGLFRQLDVGDVVTTDDDPRGQALQRSHLQFEPAVLAFGVAGIGQAEPGAAPRQHRRDAVGHGGRLRLGGAVDAPAHRLIIAAHPVPAARHAAIGGEVAPRPIDLENGAVGVEDSDMRRHRIEDRVDEIPIGRQIAPLQMQPAGKRPGHRARRRQQQTTSAQADEQEPPIVIQPIDLFDFDHGVEHQLLVRQLDMVQHRRHTLEALNVGVTGNLAGDHRKSRKYNALVTQPALLERQAIDRRVGQCGIKQRWLVGHDHHAQRIGEKDATARQPPRQGAKIGLDRDHPGQTIPHHDRCREEEPGNVGAQTNGKLLAAAALDRFLEVVAPAVVLADKILALQIIAGGETDAVLAHQPDDVEPQLLLEQQQEPVDLGDQRRPIRGRRRLLHQRIRRHDGGNPVQLLQAGTDVALFLGQPQGRGGLRLVDQVGGVQIVPPATQPPSRQDQARQDDQQKPKRPQRFGKEPTTWAIRGNGFDGEQVLIDLNSGAFASTKRID